MDRETALVLKRMENIERKLLDGIWFVSIPNECIGILNEIEEDMELNTEEMVGLSGVYGWYGKVTRTIWQPNAQLYRETLSNRSRDHLPEHHNLPGTYNAETNLMVSIIDILKLMDGQASIRFLKPIESIKILDTVFDFFEEAKSIHFYDPVLIKLSFSDLTSKLLLLRKKLLVIKNIYAINKNNRGDTAKSIFDTSSKKDNSNLGTVDMTGVSSVLLDAATSYDSVSLGGFSYGVR